MLLSAAERCLFSFVVTAGDRIYFERPDGPAVNQGSTGYFGEKCRLLSHNRFTSSLYMEALIERHLFEGFDYEFQVIRLGWDGLCHILFKALDKVSREKYSEVQLLTSFNLLANRHHKSHRYTSFLNRMR